MPTQASQKNSGDERLWQTCFVVCCAALITPLWVTDWLPLVDIPQHAAQLAIAKRWSNPAFDYPSYFQLNWFANSIVPYTLTYAFTVVAPILVAIKLVLCLALVGIPLVTSRLVAALGGNRWWVFATFPVAYGYAFAWGFLTFVLAAPVGLLLVLQAIRFRAEPTGKRALVMSGLCYLLFASHVLVLAYAGLVALGIVVLGTTSWRVRFKGALALASVLPIGVAWWVGSKLLTPGTTPLEGPLELGYGLYRFPQLMSSMIGAEQITAATVIPGLVFVALPFLIGARSSREPWRLVPLAVTLAFHFLIPQNVLATAFVSARFGLFLVPSLLVALEPTARERRPVRLLAVLVAVIWLALVAGRYYAFGVESRGVARLIEQIEPNRRVLSLIDNPRSGVVPWSPYLHAGCWYQVSRGGISDFSFAEFFPNRFRYRPGKDPPLPYNIEWEPQRFRYTEHGGELYDYFLVRRSPGAKWTPFLGATHKIEVVGNVGTWWLFRQTR